MSAYPVLTAHPGRPARTLDGKTFFPADDGFDEARRAWNLAVDRRPAAVVFPESAQDVAAAVRFAAATGSASALGDVPHEAGEDDLSGDPTSAPARAWRRRIHAYCGQSVRCYQARQVLYQAQIFGDPCIR